MVRPNMGSQPQKVRLGYAIVWELGLLTFQMRELLLSMRGVMKSCGMKV